jgi:hypothetical protein
MAFTVARLCEQLQITAEQSDQVIGLIRGTVDPFSIAGTDAWRRQCYHEPDPRKPETRMHAIDQVLGTYGTEAIWSSRSCTQPAAEYCNTGDSYAATILYDYVAEQYRLCAWGDFVEKYERRYQLQ